MIYSCRKVWINVAKRLRGNMFIMLCVMECSIDVEKKLESTLCGAECENAVHVFLEVCSASVVVVRLVLW